MIDGDNSRLYPAQLRGPNRIASGVYPESTASTIKFEVQVLDRAGETASHTYRVRLPR